MQPVPNVQYPTMICLARRDQSPTAPSLSSLLDSTLEELQFTRTYNLGPKIYVCEVQDRGGLLVCPHPGKYIGDAIDEKTEGMLLTIGLEETLKRLVIAACRERFANVEVAPLSVPV